MKVYLAAQYKQKHEINKYAQELRNLGIGVTSSWLEEPHAPNTQLGEVSEDTRRLYAYSDLNDIDRADAIVFFSQEPTTPTLRGGRHVEFGYGIGTRKKILVVGPRENIFHHHLSVKRTDTWEQAKVMLLQGEI